MFTTDGGWPPPLSEGDVVQVAFPSSSLGADELQHQRLRAGVAQLRSWGLSVEDPSPAECGRSWNGLAGTDKQRLEDFRPSPSSGPSRGPSESEDRLSPQTDGLSACRAEVEPISPAVALWACAQGGWGSARLLESGWEAPPGWLLGFSDVSSLLWSSVRQRRDGAGAIHGPLITTLSSEPEWSQQRLRALLLGRPVSTLRGSGWAPGAASGRLLVGNLTVVTHLIGTQHIPQLRGAVAVFEDVGEPAYKVDRMLTQWRLAGLLQQLAGIGFGRFTQRRGPNATGETPTATENAEVEAVLRERTSGLGVPVVGGLPIGHGPGGNAALPLGRVACLDGNVGELRLPH